MRQKADGLQHLCEYIELVGAAKITTMKLEFSLALATTLLAASVLAVPVPEPPNLPTDITNMVGGPKWLKSIAHTHPFQK